MGIIFMVALNVAVTHPWSGWPRVIMGVLERAVAPHRAAAQRPVHGAVPCCGYADAGLPDDCSIAYGQPATMTDVVVVKRPEETATGQQPASVYITIHPSGSS